MSEYIIKGCGKLDDILTSLKAVQHVFGKGAPLSDVATVARRARLIQAERKQFEKDGKII